MSSGLEVWPSGQEKDGDSQSESQTQAQEKVKEHQRERENSGIYNHDRDKDMDEDIDPITRFDSCRIGEARKSGIYITANFLSYAVFIPQKKGQGRIGFHTETVVSQKDTDNNNNNNNEKKKNSIIETKEKSKKSTTPRGMQRKTLLRNDNMNATPGEITYLMGPSGAGKSHLAKGVMNLFLYHGFHNLYILSYRKLVKK